MTDMAPMTWYAYAPSYLMAVAWLIVPGLAVVLVGRMRGFFALAAAPPVSVTLLSVSAIVAQLVGVPFTWVVPAAALVAFLVVAWLFGWWYDRGFHGRRLAFPAAPPAWWAAAALAAVIWAWILYNAFQRPDHFAQRFDNMWHLNAIRYIADTGDGSSLTIAHLNGSGGGFYPAAFHDLAALVMRGNGDHLTAASSAAIMAIATVVWPLSMLFFLRTIFRSSAITTLSVGVLLAAFPAFPLRILDFGPLYPNFLGLSILPLILGIAVQLGRLGIQRWLDTPRGIILGLAALPGMMLAHPNAFMMMLLITGVMAIAVAVKVVAGRHGRWSPRNAALIIAAVAYVALVVVAWPILRPGTPVTSWPPAFDTPSAAGVVITNATTDGLASWAVSLLMLVGCYAAIRKGLGWLVAVWAVIAYFFIVAASFPADEYRLMLVGIWYNDFHRFVANLPLVALPVSVIGLDHLVSAVVDRLDARVRWPSYTRVIAGTLVAAALAGCLYVATQHTEGMRLARIQAWTAYRFDDRSDLITPEEYRFLRQVQQIVPPDAVIANYPADGSGLVYALTGRHVLMPHFYWSSTPGRDTAEENLDEAATDPAVCPILRQENVRYVIDLGGVMLAASQMPEMVGLDELDTAPGFRVVARQGESRLYEITACA